MPRKRKEIHPSLMRNADPVEDDDEEMGGYPEHGDPLPDDSDAYIDDDDPDDEEDELARPETRSERIERELAELKARNALLEKRVPPEPARAATPEPEEETDWENLIFTNPKEAVEKIKEQSRKEITRELRGDYQREQSTTRFWNDFYKENDDLTEDRDIVEMELNKNFAKLADMPVPDAIAELADLTRKRIMKYSNNRGVKRKRTRAVTSGASNSSRPEQGARPAQPKVQTLSGLIKGRREKRRAAMNGRLST